MFTINATSAVLPLLAHNVSPDEVAKVQTYLGSASQAVSKASTILASTETPAQKSADIASAFAGIVAPDLPAQYQSIAAAVQEVAQMISQFLADEGALKAAVANRTRAASPAPQTFSDADKARLAQIKTQADALAKSLHP